MTNRICTYVFKSGLVIDIIIFAKIRSGLENYIQLLVLLLWKGLNAVLLTVVEIANYKENKIYWTKHKFKSNKLIVLLIFLGNYFLLELACSQVEQMIIPKKGQE